MTEPLNWDVGDPPDDLPASEDQLHALAGTIAEAFPACAIRAGVLTFGEERRLCWHIASASGRYVNLQQPFSVFASAESFEQALAETRAACADLREAGLV